MNDLLKHVVEQREVLGCQAAERNDITAVHDGKTVQVGERALIPFHIREQDETVDWIRILEYDSFRLLLFFQNIVHPLDSVASFISLNVRPSNIPVSCWRLTQNAQIWLLIFGDVLCCGWMNHVAFYAAVFLRSGKIIDTVLRIREVQG
jgi:hypothetical protein